MRCVSQRRKEAEAKGEVFDDEDIGADVVSVAGDTDSEAEEDAPGAAVSAGAGAGVGAGAGSASSPALRRVGSARNSARRAKAVSFRGATQPKKLPYIESDVRMWRHCGGRRSKEDFGAVDETGTMQTKEVAVKGGRAIVATKVFYGDEPEQEVPWHPATSIRLPNLPYVSEAVLVAVPCDSMPHACLPRGGRVVRLALWPARTARCASTTLASTTASSLRCRGHGTRRIGSLRVRGTRWCTGARCVFPHQTLMLAPQACCVWERTLRARRMRIPRV